MNADKNGPRWSPESASISVHQRLEGTRRGSIPEFPGARPLALADKPLFDRLFATMQPEISQYTFTNLLAWRQSRNTQVSRMGEVILILEEQSSVTPVRDPAFMSRRPTNDGRRTTEDGQRTLGLTFLEPMGEGPIREVMEECLRSCGSGFPSAKAATPAEVEFRYLSWNTAAVFQGDPKFTLEQDRDNSDYVYLAQDLCELAGRKYDAKRNFVRRFQSEHNYRYLPLTPDLARECRRFEERWCEDRSCQSDEGLNHEMDAVLEMLDNFEALSSSHPNCRGMECNASALPYDLHPSSFPRGGGLKGGAIEVDGSIIAFSLGEPLNRETFVVHVEKADAKLTGIYAVINQEFCKHEAAGFTYVNREQDLGIPGLRQAKLSYHPVRIVDTYRLTRIEVRSVN